MPIDSVPVSNPSSNRTSPQTHALMAMYVDQKSTKVGATYQNSASITPET